MFRTTSAKLTEAPLRRALKKNSREHAGGLSYPFTSARTNANTGLLASAGAKNCHQTESKGDAVARAGMERAALRR